VATEIIHVIYFNMTVGNKQTCRNDHLEKLIISKLFRIVQIVVYYTIMKANYKFQNLCGTVYRQGNVVFTSDGNSVLSPVGNRVSVFDLVK
jgi:periodic tryptophan protein 2